MLLPHAPDLIMAVRVLQSKRDIERMPAASFAKWGVESEVRAHQAERAFVFGRTNLVVP